MAGRARSRGYDERWLLRLLMRELYSPLVAASVAHHCFLSRSFKIALVEYAWLHERCPSEPLLLLCCWYRRMVGCGRGVDPPAEPFGVAQVEAQQRDDRATTRWPRRRAEPHNRSA